jgi:hypothetical protein
VSGFLFEWSPAKALDNWRKHGVGFDEATTVFGDPFSQTMYDPDHSTGEERYVTVGRSSSHRLLLVVHTERGNRIRIISARASTSRERKHYEERSEKAI